MSEQTYQFAEIERKWQKYWRDIELFKMDPKSEKPKYYCLVMFPYPSGGLHMGHVLVYTIGDALARYRIMRGYNVLSPMGWDAFGLPAENAAIRAKSHPEKITMENIALMRQQINDAGWGYDWSREIATCKPEYYKWTQWIFLQMHKKGLAYRKKMPINWCPECKTGLANEEAAGGTCERCGAPVTKKMLFQWMLRITNYAERLLQDLDKLDWHERIKKMQANWIGKSTGAEAVFKVAESDEAINIYTTRADTLFGATFMVLAPEHPAVEKITTGDRIDEVRRYVQNTMQLSGVDRMNESREKTGVFTGAYGINPINGEKIPIWVSDYVLMEYGTGAIMCVPAHDERDFEFAKKFGLEIRRVIAPDPALADAPVEEVYTGDGVMVNSGEFTGLASDEGQRRVAEKLAQMGVGGPAVNYKLRDWIFSRQRYWGEPIPIVYCDRCGEVRVPEEELPLELPKVEHYQPTGTGESPLATVTEWVNTTCPECGGPAKRETDTMPQWAGSCWYFLRYVDPHNDAEPWDKELVNHWLPVDQYVGGIEHAVLHLLYSRFYTKFLHDIGAIDFDEPFARLFNQGMIYKDGAKMSKSKGNVVNPSDVLRRFGADAMRLYILFMGPPEKDSEWSDAGLNGAFRFLKRLYETVRKEAASLQGVPPYRGEAERLPEKVRAVYRKLHATVAKVSDEMDKSFHYNTAIAAVMELTNALRDMPRDGEHSLAVLRLALETTVKLIAPITPHISEELWEALGNEPSVFRQPWPEADERIAAPETVEIAVQIRGKVRSRIRVAADASEDEVRRRALEDARVVELLGGAQVRKVIVVPGRIVNIVT